MMLTRLFSSPVIPTMYCVLGAFLRTGAGDGGSPGSDTVHSCTLSGTPSCTKMGGDTVSLTLRETGSSENCSVSTDGSGLCRAASNFFLIFSRAFGLSSKTACDTPLGDSASSNWRTSLESLKLQSQVPSDHPVCRTRCSRSFFCFCLKLTLLMFFYLLRIFLKITLRGKLLDEVLLTCRIT